MLSIVLTVGSLDPRDGGPTRTVSALGHALAAAPGGGRVTLVTCATGSPTHTVSGAIETRVVSHGRWAARTVRGIRSAPFRRAVLRAARETDARLIHDNGLWLQTNHGAARAAREAGVPLVISPRGMLDPWALGYHRWRKQLAWHLFQHDDLRMAAMIHATSDLERRHLRAQGLGNPIAMVPNGVAMPRALPAPKSSDRATRTMLFLSRVHPQKGLLELIDAWAAVRPVAWRLVIAGPASGGHDVAVRRAAAAAGIAEAVTFVGEVDGDAKTRLFASADVFVLPSHAESFGVVVAEALAHGVPAITTTATPWDRLPEWGCGWCVELDTGLPDALRHATTLSDAERAAMGQRGRAEVERRFSWAGVASEMQAAYRWIVEGGPLPACVSLT